MSLTLSGITWHGPDCDDLATLAELPTVLRVVLEAVNGFVLFGGALHVRGAVHHPAWHSLADAWRGQASVALAYPNVRETDVPFAQDCVGDQFLLRDGEVVVLRSETAEFSSLGVGLISFLERACDDPIGFLAAQPLVQFREAGNELVPGRVLLAYPPYCTEESAQGVALRAVPAQEALAFHADFARQTGRLPEGERVRVSPK